MTNIFENAKFGDKFVTRDGGIAIFICIDYGKDFDAYFAKLIDSVTCKAQYYNLNGLMVPDEELDCDIISKYQEPIDEDELNEQASDWVDDLNFNRMYTQSLSDMLVDAYEAGYRKAKEK